jgi:hypothetical protein
MPGPSGNRRTPAPGSRGLLPGVFRLASQPPCLTDSAWLLLMGFGAARRR